MCTSGAQSWGEGDSGVRDMAPLSLRNLGAKFSDTSFPHFKTYFTQSTVVTFRQQLKTFNSNNFTLSSMFSFQNAWPRKRKAVYTFVLFHIFIYFLVRIRLDHNLHIF